VFTGEITRKTQKIDAQEMGSRVHLNSVFLGDVTNSLMEMVAEDMGDRVHPNPWRNKNVVLSNNEDKKNSYLHEGAEDHQSSGNARWQHPESFQIFHLQYT
jgi:hypothetical protein